MISFRMGAGLLGAFVWLPRPQEKGGGTSARCCAELLCWLLQILVPCCPPTPCFPQLPPRGQSAVTQSSFSVREAASPRSGMSKMLGHRANSIYNRIFARSRTPKRAKLVLGTSAVHVRSRLCSCFFGVGIQKNEKRAILCEKGAYCELVSSLGPHPLKVGVPTALQDANRADPVRLSSPPDAHGWRGFGETQSYAQVRRGIVLWWGVPRCRLHSGGRVQCREAVRLGVAHAEGCPLVLPGGRRGERHGHPCGKCWRAGSRHWFGGACRRLAASQCGASLPGWQQGKPTTASSALARARRHVLHCGTADA